MTSHRLLRCFVWGVAAYICWRALLSGADFDDGIVAYSHLREAVNSLRTPAGTVLMASFKPPSAKERGNLGTDCCSLTRPQERKSLDRPLGDQEIEQLFGYNPGAFSVTPIGSLSTTWGDLKTANQDAKDR